MLSLYTLKKNFLMSDLIFKMWGLPKSVKLPKIVPVNGHFLETAWVTKHYNYFLEMILGDKEKVIGEQNSYI